MGRLSSVVVLRPETIVGGQQRAHRAEELLMADLVRVVDIADESGIHKVLPSARNDPVPGT
jgi:hypothetical protein